MAICTFKTLKCMAGGDDNVLRHIVANKINYLTKN